MTFAISIKCIITKERYGLCFSKRKTLDKILPLFSKLGLMLPAFLPCLQLIKLETLKCLATLLPLTSLANNVEKSKEEEAKATEEFISCFRIKRPL